MLDPRSEEIVSAYVFWSECPDIGPVKLKKLIEIFGSVQSAAVAEESRLISALGTLLGEKVIKFRRHWDPKKTNEKMEKWGIEALIIEDIRYPKMLKLVDDAPYLIFTKFNPSATIDLAYSRPAIAVVGSRKITGYGRQVAETIVADLVNAGIVIVSGLMYGVDEVAHRAAVKSGGQTIGVWAGGIDTLWGTSREPLAKLILENDGILLTEFPLGLTPTPGLFPARNRIVSGLSRGVVVVEAAKDSGSIITAGYAAAQGREVFAVPGPVTSPQSLGTAKLIQDGAMLITGADDILNTLGLSYSAKRKTHQDILVSLDSSDQKTIYELLLGEHHSVDELVRLTGWETGKLTGVLTQMELGGLIRDIGGLIFGVAS